MQENAEDDSAEAYGFQKDTYRIREEVALPGTKESIGQILVTDVSLRRLDIRPGQDEISLRGELQIFCMYLSAGEKADWFEQSVPFEGVSCATASRKVCTTISGMN